jgi:hypothetical protein
MIRRQLDRIGRLPRMPSEAHVNDAYREEREARWRDGLVNYASVFEMLGERLRTVAKDPDCDQAKKESDEIAHLCGRTSARQVNTYSAASSVKASERRTGTENANKGTAGRRCSQTHAIEFCVSRKRYASYGSSRPVVSRASFSCSANTAGNFNYFRLACSRSGMVSTVTDVVSCRGMG